MFELNKNYTRIEIAAKLGIKDLGEVDRAVLVGKAAIAIVVNALGKHPSDASFQNELTESSFTMEGKEDPRGHLIEQKDKKFHLFFSHETDGEYAYEGLVMYAGKSIDEISKLLGRPRRKYKRVSVH
jgi:hypothetical protein